MIELTRPFPIVIYSIGDKGTGYLKGDGVSWVGGFAPTQASSENSLRTS
jgi:hypothetical protein